MEKEHNKTIKSLRKWCSESFEKQSVLSTKYLYTLSDIPSRSIVTKEENGKKKTNYNDFDLQCKIVQLFQVDDFVSEMRVIDDSGEIWHLQVHLNKFRFLKEGLYVRIRGGTLLHHEKCHRMFGLRPYSNIINLPYPCKLAQDMMFDEPSEKAAFETQQLASKDPLPHPIIVSQINDKKLHYTKLTTLSTLLQEAKKPEADPETIYKVRFCVAAAP